MNKFVKQIVEDKFDSKAQQRMFFAKAKKSKKWRKWAKGKAEDTDFSKIPEKVDEKKTEEEKEQMKLSIMVTRNLNSQKLSTLMEIFKQEIFLVIQTGILGLRKQLTKLQKLRWVKWVHSVFLVEQLVQIKH